MRGPWHQYDSQADGDLGASHIVSRVVDTKPDGVWVAARDTAAERAAQDLAKEMRKSYVAFSDKKMKIKGAHTIIARLPLRSVSHCVTFSYCFVDLETW